MALTRSRQRVISLLLVFLADVSPVRLPTTGRPQWEQREPRTNDMPIEKYAARCQYYAFFRLQYSWEFYCCDEPGGNQDPGKECSMLCIGDKTEWCVDPVTLNVYAKPAAKSSSSTSSTTVKTSMSSDAESIPSRPTSPTTDQTSTQPRVLFNED